ncbi:MAG: hypothetical protein R2822_11865 [Spirosomataceae bacterium]
MTSICYPKQVMTAEILKTYLRRLTNLSTRNRSLLLTSLPSEQFLDWKSLDFVENRSAFDLLKEVIAQKKIRSYVQSSIVAQRK